MLIEVCAAVHSLMKPIEFSARRSVTDLAVERAMRSCGMIWMVPAMRLTSSGRPVAVTTVGGMVVAAGSEFFVHSCATAGEATADNKAAKAIPRAPSPAIRIP